VPEAVLLVVGPTSGLGHVHDVRMVSRDEYAQRANTPAATVIRAARPAAWPLLDMVCILADNSVGAAGTVADLARRIDG